MPRALLVPHFKRQLKRLNKKYPFLIDALVAHVETFDKRLHTHLGKNLYKIRLKSKDIPKGKRGSFRIIILLIEVDDVVVPLTIYFKGDRSDISKKELNNHLEIILWELRQMDV